ncbi:MAG: hypothetical protein RI567_14255 [Marinobacter sp.]|nr:hypothetical protein [Marinobacter sp.]
MQIEKSDDLPIEIGNLQKRSQTLGTVSVVLGVGSVLLAVWFGLVVSGVGL